MKYALFLVGVIIPLPCSFSRLEMKKNKKRAPKMALEE
jgi:hypothetical protein